MESKSDDQTRANDENAVSSRNRNRAAGIKDRNYQALLDLEGGCFKLDEKSVSDKENDESVITNLFDGFYEAVGLLEAIREGQAIIVREPEGILYVPRWQFTGEGNVLPGLVQVLGVLKKLPYYTGLTAMIFMLNRRSFLGGRRPIDALRENKPKDIKRVMDLAQDELH
mgnify:CR=1 FL=1